MRLAQRSSAAASTCVRRCIVHAPHTSVPRTAVLARWTGADAAAKVAKAAAAPQGIVGKGMSFASSLLCDVAPSTRSASTNASADDTVGDVPWDLCERMDYYVQYNIPSTWQVVEVLRDNSVAIQCSPPPPADAQDGSASPGTVHGISLNCFAYKQRVKQPDSTRLLHVFLKRFNASVSNSLELLAEGHPPPPLAEAKLPPSMSGSDASGPAAAPSAAPADGDAAEAHACQALAKQLNSAVAEITFTPAPGQPLAHGLCRAFFNSNGRFHYVMVVAVPEDEFANSLDLVIHALASVVESRVEAAAKRT